MRFINPSGHDVRIISDSEKREYFFSGDKYQLKLILKHHPLSVPVTFRAQTKNYDNLFINGKDIISVSPTLNCDAFVNVTVTSQPTGMFSKARLLLLSS